MLEIRFGDTIPLERREAELRECAKMLLDAQFDAVTNLVITMEPMSNGKPLEVSSPDPDAPTPRIFIANSLVEVSPARSELLSA
ncbi:MAG: hypothetical protein EON58_11655 [Alphaproteobacteria bacterium]|nr:MAG: hypothetical protein EON58_11655 [Alphaproteobacteria bacterium]